MNEAGFLAELAELKDHDWHIAECGEIRLRTDRPRDACPIGAVCYSLNGTKLDAWEFYGAADALGLSRADAKRIVLAADHVSVGFSDYNCVALRSEMLDALGLEERQT